jgi:hypothetical protein
MVWYGGIECISDMAGRQTGERHESWNKVLPKEYKKRPCVRSRLIPQLLIPMIGQANIRVQDALRIGNYFNNHSILLSLMHVASHFSQ